jgi:hypothetical protein
MVPAGGVKAKVPGTVDVVSSWLAPSAVPAGISAGLAQLSIGIAFSTLMVVELEAVVKSIVSVGVNVTDRT